MTGTRIIGRPRPHREQSSNTRARDRAGARIRSRWPARWSVLALALAVAATVACGTNGAGKDSSASQASGSVAAQSTSAAVARVGQPAPGFQVATIDGSALTSADLIAQQKPYILYFFASW